MMLPKSSMITPINIIIYICMHIFTNSWGLGFGVVKWEPPSTSLASNFNASQTFLALPENVKSQSHRDRLGPK